MKNLKNLGKALSKVEQKEISGGDVPRCTRRKYPCYPQAGLDGYLIDNGSIIGCCAIAISVVGPAG